MSNYSRQPWMDHKVTLGFSRGGHTGTDFAWVAPLSSTANDITSPVSGKVVGVGKGTTVRLSDGRSFTAGYNYGNSVWVIDQAGHMHMFAHMNSATPLGLGQVVSVGQKLGHTGATGNVTGAHTHWSVALTSDPAVWRNHLTDPVSYLASRIAEEAEQPQLTDTQIALQILDGPNVWGNGDDRKQKLGGRYSAVQAEVNRIWAERQTPAQTPTTYAVVKGDNLTRIAHRFGTTVAKLVAWNGIPNPNLIHPGQVLRVG